MQSIASYSIIPSLLLHARAVLVGQQRSVVSKKKKRKKRKKEKKKGNKEEVKMRRCFFSREEKMSGCSKGVSGESCHDLG